MLTLEKDNFLSYLKNIKQYSTHTLKGYDRDLGKLVEYHEGRGWAIDVDIDGSLIIETPEGKMINLTSPLITEVK